MKRVVSGMVAALLSLFFLSACIEKNDLLGSALVPTNQDISIKTATFDLPVDLRMADSLQCAVSQSITVGSLRTDSFGRFRSEAAMTVTASTDTVEWGLNPSVRHIYISFVRDTTLFVDDSQEYIPQNLHLYYLNTKLDSTYRYNNSLSFADCDPTPIADPVPYTGESAYSVDLDPSFGERFFRIPIASIYDDDLMMEAFHGLYMTCDDPEDPLEGGRLNAFDLSSSVLYLEYDYDDGLGNRKSKTASFQLGEYYSLNVCSSEAGKLVTDDPASAIYMEGLCGIKPHIPAAQLRSMIAEWAAANEIPLDRLIVAKATVEFPFEFSGDPDQFDAWPDNIFPCKRVYTNGILSYGPIQEISDDSLELGLLDRSFLTFESNVSIYLQGLLRKSPGALTAEDDLWMMSTVSMINSYTSETSYFSDYFYYQQCILNGTDAERHPILNLTYTVLQ